MNKPYRSSAAFAFLSLFLNFSAVAAPPKPGPTPAAGQPSK